MSDFHKEPTYPVAKKEHRCIYCGGPILTGEHHAKQDGFYNGAWYHNRYHDECFDDCAEEFRVSGSWEFTPFSAEYPERIKAIVLARRSAETLK